MSNRAKSFANIVLGSMIILLLFMLGYALLRSNLHAPGHMNKYYIFSMTGALFFAYSLLKINPEMKVNIALMTVTILLGLYAIEIILSYNINVKPEPIRAELAAKNGRAYDSRHRLQVWKDLRNKGVNANPLYNPYVNMDLKDTEVLPLGYISNITAIFCNENGGFITFKSDEYGFNNPDSLYIKDKIDYVLIGDSFAQGACVKREENISGRLRSAGRNVVNLGMLNSGPPIELAILKEYAKPFRPKTVFWLFYEGNDHEGLEFEKKSPLIMKYLDKNFTQDLVHKQKQVDDMILTQLEKEYASIDDTLKLIEDNKKTLLNKFSLSLSSLTLSQLRNRLLNNSRAKCKSTIDPLFKDIMKEAKRVIDNWNGQLVFIYLPSYDRYMERASKCRISFLTTEKKEVLSVINSLDIPVLDLEAIFSSQPDPLVYFPYRLFGHYNARGYLAVAEQIEKYLSDHPENPE